MSYVELSGKTINLLPNRMYFLFLNIHKNELSYLALWNLESNMQEPVPACVPSLKLQSHHGHFWSANHTFL